MLKAKIVELCQLRNITVKQLSIDTEFSEPTFYRWFKEDTMEIKHLKKIADYFGVDIKYFFESTGERVSIASTPRKVEEPQGRFTIAQDPGIKDKYIAVLEENARLLRELGECKERMVRYETEGRANE